MKLSDIIHFATTHDKFLNFLNEKNISPDSAHEILAKISNETPSAVEHRIYIDFGDRGATSSDIRIIVDLDKNDGSFHFIQIDNPTR